MSSESKYKDSFLSKVWNFIKNNWGKLLLLIAVLMGALFFVSNKKEVKINTTKPSLSTLIETVDVSGQVESSNDAKLSFEKSAIVNNVNVKVGDKVKQGQVLAYLSGSDSYSSVKEAEAGLAAQVASLNQLKAGATNEELNIKRQNLDNAKSDLKNAEDDTDIKLAESQIEDTLRNTRNTLNDILDYKLSTLLSKDGFLYKLNFTSCDNGTQMIVENNRNSLSGITSSIFDLSTAKTSADQVNSLIVDISNILTLPCSLSDISLNDERALISSLKSQISGLFSEISSRKTLIQNLKTSKNNQLLSAQNAVKRAEKDLALSVAGTDINRIRVGQAGVSQAKARLDSARVQASKNVLLAPFDGVITQVNIVKGETVSPNFSAINIIADSAFEIKSKLAEVDIVKVKVGDLATVTLDAYPNQEFSAIVSNVDPAASLESGVPRYGINLTFTQKDDKVKSGMTANAKIVALKKDNTLSIPASYIDIKSGGGIVKVKNATSSEDRIVKTGIRSNDGKVEIIEGLTENDILLEIAKDGESKK